MATLTMDGVTWTYTYDANGMRTSRSNGTTTYNYVYTGDKLTRMTIVTTGSTQTVDISYDASGTPLTLTYTPNGSTTGTTYYYVTNIQGDVTGLTDTTGKLIISYFYTGYGDSYCVKHNDTTANILSAVNPLCYRGYVLDTQTKLYYLQSRYYDYTHGRFINADALISTGQGLLGNNMFAYCLNNPVMRFDPTGTFPEIIGILLEYLFKCGLSGTINLATTELSAILLGQELSNQDRFFAFLAGAGGGISPTLGGAIGGGYAMYSSYMAGDELLVILTKGGISFFFSSVNLGGLSEFFDGAALDIVTACFTFGYNFMSTVTNELLNDMGIESIVIANANAFPWASPNYDPLSSSNKKNINAIPWSSPDYSPS